VSQAALGVNTSLFALCFAVFNFLATATTPLLASAVAAGDRRAAGEVCYQATALATVLGLAVAALLATQVRWR
jgi:Na+-driven multidrug efflux pump